MLTLFNNYLKGKTCRVYAAPFDVRLPQQHENEEHTSTVVQPDLVIVCDKTKLDHLGCKGNPDLVVEITSPSTFQKDLKEKFILYIVVANTIYEQLQYLFPGQVGRYHSKMDEWSRKEILRKYHDAQIRILVSCRALDEGLNVPSTDIGIIASSTSSTRQRIQRLGRILRQSGIKHSAKLYYLYIGSSNEEKDLLARISRDLTGIIPILDLEYDHDSQTFHNFAYEALADRVIAYTLHKGWSKKIITEITSNLERGMLGCDWWLSEQDCRLKIRNAASRSEQNYWVSMCLLVQASLGRLTEG